MSAIKEWNLQFTKTGVELDNITLTVISQLEKDKYNDFTHVAFTKQNTWAKKIKTRKTNQEPDY